MKSLLRYLSPRLRRGLRADEGSNLVELGLAVAILMPLLIGAIEFSLVFLTYHDMTDAARQAVRWAAVRGSTSCTNTPNLIDCNATSAEIQSFVQGIGYPGLTPANISVSTSWLVATSSTPTSWSACEAATCNSPGNQVQVVVRYAYPLSIPYWKATTFHISSTAAMVVAQ
ncbi:MAG: TadE/TadG family type IV pilus assembly protein [Acidobacteriota bacterium]